MARNPLRDRIAVVGVGSTAYGRDLQRSELSLGLEAALTAIEDAGMDRQEIDGICGTGMTPLAVGGAGFLALQGALGIDEIRWGLNAWLGSCFVYAAEAVFSGTCDAVLIVQSYLRELGMSRSAANDPFRLRAGQMDRGQKFLSPDDFARRWVHSGEPYAAIMQRYMHDYGVDKDAFARIAVNSRSHGVRNPNAAMRTPMSLDDYHGSRMIWSPMQMLDMDVPVDCAEALIITTVERARDLRQEPALIHAITLGGSRVGEYYENNLGWTENAGWIAHRALWDKSEIRGDDIDLLYPYDGYSIDAVAFIEAGGFCKPGEAGAFLADSWDGDANMLRLNGRTLVNTHGGGLSQGRAGGFNAITEAVRQVRGTAGERQAEHAETALISSGSFFHDPAIMLLRRDG